MVIAFDQVVLGAVEEPVAGLTRPRRDDDGRRTEPGDPFGLFAPRGFPAASGQQPCLRPVGSHHRRPRQQIPGYRVEVDVAGDRGAGGRGDHRVHHDRDAPLGAAGKVHSDGAQHFRAPRRADLHCRDRQLIEHRVELGVDRFDRQRPAVPHPGHVLCCHSHHYRGGVTTDRGVGLDIALDAGPATGITRSDSEADRHLPRMRGHCCADLAMTRATAPSSCWKISS